MSETAEKYGNPSGMSEGKQMTAVEWLEDVYNKQGRILPQQFEQAKAMHKEAIKNVHTLGSFYSDNFGFETIEFENTQDGTILIRCDSPEDLVTFEMSKERAVKMALAVLKNCL